MMARCGFLMAMMEVDGYVINLEGHSLTFGGENKHCVYMENKKNEITHNTIEGQQYSECPQACSNFSLIAHDSVNNIG